MLVQYERIGWVSFKKLFLIIFFFSNFKYLTFRVTIIFFFFIIKQKACTARNELLCQIILFARCKSTD